MRSPIAFGFTAMLAALASGCGQSHEYLAESAFALTEDTPPFLQSMDATLYIVEARTTFPIRRPSDADLHNLNDVGNIQIPFPRFPWVRRGDVEEEITFTVSNMLNAPASVSVTVNGINEFDEYRPSARIVDRRLQVDFSQWERLYDLKPLERKTVVIREEEFDEVATDLATVVNGAPNSNLVVGPDSQSSIDPRVQQYIPPIIPGLVGVYMGLRTEAQARVVLEVSIRLRDVNSLLAPSGTQPWRLPAPTPFAPVAPMMQ